MKTKAQFSRCHISSELVHKITKGASNIGEGFWITLKNDDVAIVQNILLCGLGVDDEIKVRSGDEDRGEHPNEFVRVVKRKSRVTGVRYSLRNGDEVQNSLPVECSEFLKELETQKIRFEGCSKGLALMQYPRKMTRQSFVKQINSGPFVFEEIR